jgi:hypothetical protein
MRTRLDSVKLGLVIVLAFASCAGIQERVEKLRAQRVEIVDDKDQVKMDVEKELRTLNERVTRLEAELAKAKEARPAPQPVTVAPPPVATESPPAAKVGTARKGPDKSDVF